MPDLIKKKGGELEDDCAPVADDCFEDAVSSAKEYSGDLKAFEGMV